MTQLIHFTAPLCVTRSFPVAGIPRSETSPELAENIRGLPPQKSVAMILEFDEDGEKANGELSAPRRQVAPDRSVEQSRWDVHRAAGESRDASASDVDVTSRQRTVERSESLHAHALHRPHLHPGVRLSSTPAELWRQNA